MQRLLCFNFTLIVFFLFGFVYGQEGGDGLTRESFNSEIDNLDVIDAKLWHHQGDVEKSLKKGLEIISSNIPLSALDEFNTYQILAYNFRDLGADQLALEHAEKAIDALEKSKLDNSKRTSWIAPYYSAVKQYDLAIQFMKRDISRFQMNSDTLSLLKVYNDIGFTYSLNSQVDSAIFYFEKVLLFDDDSEKYKAVLGLATGNLGAVYMEQGELLKALSLLLKDAELSKGRDEASYYNAMNSVGECYLLLHQYQKAKTNLLELLSVREFPIKSRLKTYSLLADVFEKTNEVSNSIKYLKKNINLKDSIQNLEVPVENVYRQLADSKVSGIKKDLELTENKIKTEKAKNNIYLFVIILVLIFVLIFAILYRSRQKRISKIQRLETNLVQSELENKKKDLTNMVTNLNYKRKFIDEVKDRLKQIESELTGESAEKLTEVIREFNKYKNADKNIAAFQLDIDKVNLSFYKKLGKMFPTLTENEKQLCGLFLLKLSTKDIASIRSVTPNAVKKARQRIRKKLPISEHVDLVYFLGNI